GLQRLAHRRQVVLVARRQEEQVGRAIVEVRRAGAERRVVGLGMGWVALDEVLVERRRLRPVVALEGHVGDGELRKRRILRVGEVVADVLAEAGGLPRDLILLLLLPLAVPLA